jgi:uncharacterized protein YndB with AHSA1/START domain
MIGPDEVLHDTFSVERAYDAPVERVFNAFADPAIKRRWFAEGEGFTIEAFSLEFRVGGREQTRFSTVDGMAIRNETWYLDIVKNRRIVLAYTMSAGDRPFSASLATFEFIDTGGSTRLRMTEQGAWFEGGDGPQLRSGGWGSLLDALGGELMRLPSD